jgi:hypothetical protein
MKEILRFSIVKYYTAETMNYWDNHENKFTLQSKG